ncbi:hypothetical protein ILYODFUR_010188 [Ilyodon furcidens]|uniref:Uncharacterized protein n=1 Tax=Ilyodon furcidens TaxID=33524 RepID=A0ABV0UGQ1_9TELE
MFGFQTFLQIKMESELDLGMDFEKHANSMMLPPLCVSGDNVQGICSILHEAKRFSFSLICTEFLFYLCCHMPDLSEQVFCRTWGHAEEMQSFESVMQEQRSF